MDFDAFLVEMVMKNLSYWERTTWLSQIDYAIVGSGIVGLSCALMLKKKEPSAKIVVFEKGILPSGASTKNAGFGCFGSLSELLDDLTKHSPEEVLQLVKERLHGLQLLRETIGDSALSYQEYGGYELFTKADQELFENCLSKLEETNRLLHPLFGGPVFSECENKFGFKNIQPRLIFNAFEGQLDTGKMMCELLQKVTSLGVLVLNTTEVTALEDNGDNVALTLNNSEEVEVNKVCVATNGFAQQLLDQNVRPARAQVLVTKPMDNLDIQGTFHLDKGYYYFRNIDNRILLGGGRNLDFKTEETSEVGLTSLVQNKLEVLLHTTILPDRTFEIDTRWSGIMGVGSQKKPIVQQLTKNTFCGVRLGGMGVAIGSTIGNQLASIASH